MQDSVSKSKQIEQMEDRGRVIAWSALGFALLQSVCTAVIAASGMRFALGLGAFITSVATSAPSQNLHSDKFRLPMLFFATIGAIVNLGVLWQVRRLRNRPASQWRMAPVTPKKRRLEHWQFALSVLTILLVVAELISHKKIHGTPF
jgi:uncharacterized membrane protein